jgi:hypothetical protein
MTGKSKKSLPLTFIFLILDLFYTITEPVDISIANIEVINITLGHILLVLIHYDPL